MRVTHAARVLVCAVIACSARGVARADDSIAPGAIVAEVRVDRMFGRWPLCGRAHVVGAIEATVLRVAAGTLASPRVVIELSCPAEKQLAIGARYRARLETKRSDWPPVWSAKSLPPALPHLYAKHFDRIAAKPDGEYSVDELRSATGEIATIARANGARPGPSFAACEALRGHNLVTTCVSLGPGAGGDILDRASFEITNGRGLIQHYASDEAFDRARDAFATLETQFGTFVVANRGARLIFAGAEQLRATDRERVRALFDALQLPTPRSEH